MATRERESCPIRDGQTFHPVASTASGHISLPPKPRDLLTF
jgi:hypothetical protein